MMRLFTKKNYYIKVIVSFIGLTGTGGNHRYIKSGSLKIKTFWEKVLPVSNIN
jgi:hypothetical protein